MPGFFDWASEKILRGLAAGRHDRRYERQNRARLPEADMPFDCDGHEKPENLTHEIENLRGDEAGPEFDQFLSGPKLTSAENLLKRPHLK